MLSMVIDSISSFMYSKLLVPVMGVAYIVVALIVVVINIRYIPDVFATIFREAFESNFRSIFRFGHDAGNPPGIIFK